LEAILPAYITQLSGLTGFSAEISSKKLKSQHQILNIETFQLDNEFRFVGVQRHHYIPQSNA
jgi:hypothetical protein